MGYGAFPKCLITYMWRAKQPYNVSVASETAARAALTNPAYLDKVGLGSWSRCDCSAGLPGVWTGLVLPQHTTILGWEGWLVKLSLTWAAV